MPQVVKDSVEAILFIFLTFSLYLLFMVTVPILKETHGLLVMADLPEYTRDGLITKLLFGSAGACVLLGVLIRSWVPAFSTGVLANLFAATFLFLWIDLVSALTIQTKTWHYFSSLGIGFIFIYLFFFFLDYLNHFQEESSTISSWKAQLVPYWLWGWMGFYLGLSLFLAFHFIMEPGPRFLLAMGAMIVCFLNYLLNLFFKKSQGKDVGHFSLAGRIFFTLWALGLFILWIGFQWFV